MPSIVLVTEDNRVFNFNQSDYFLFPTAKNTTRQKKSWFGIEVINMDPLYDKINLNDIYFGMLFVKKYSF
jgi:hypothetical protein